MKTPEERFFVDQRGGCIAVRDRQHPKHDPSYPGLHFDTIDVVYYQHGRKSAVRHEWTVDDQYVVVAGRICNHLNSQFQETSLLREELQRLSKEKEELREEINQFRDRTKELHEQNDKMRAVLEGYERWEADILMEDKLWMPLRAQDVLRGPIYDKMLDLQQQRNEVLYPDKYASKEQALNPKE